MRRKIGDYLRFVSTMDVVKNLQKTIIIFVMLILEYGILDILGYLLRNLYKKLKIINLKLFYGLLIGHVVAKGGLIHVLKSIFTGELIRINIKKAILPMI